MNFTKFYNEQLSLINRLDFSLKEVTAVKFRQCTDKEMKSAPNGVTMPYDADFNERKKAFQFKYKCVDLSDYKKMMEKQVEQEINIDDLYDNLNNLSQ